VRRDAAHRAQKPKNLYLHGLLVVHLAQKVVHRANLVIQAGIVAGLVVRNQVQDAGEALRVLAQAQFFVLDNQVQVLDGPGVFAAAEVWARNFVVQSGYTARPVNCAGL